MAVTVLWLVSPVSWDFPKLPRAKFTYSQTFTLPYINMFWYFKDISSNSPTKYSILQACLGLTTTLVTPMTNWQTEQTDQKDQNKLESSCLLTLQTMSPWLTRSVTVTQSVTVTIVHNRQHRTTNHI